MRVALALVIMIFSCTAMPAMARDDISSSTRYLLNERFQLPEASGSDIEKLRTARYGLREPDDDYFEPAANAMRFRWKLNRVKMRIPFSTAGLR